MDNLTGGGLARIDNWNAVCLPCRHARTCSIAVRSNIGTGSEPGGGTVAAPWNSAAPLTVMPGLVPGIHVGPPPRPLPARTAMPRDVDGRNKSGHDGGG